MKNLTKKRIIVAFLIFVAMLIFLLVPFVSAADIASCDQDPSVANTAYYLTADISSAGTCLIIGADNITIDCQGFRIDYAQSSSGHGIYSLGHSNITVKSCIIDGGAYSTSHGVYFYNTNNGTIFNSTIDTSGASSNGIQAYSSEFNNISNNTISTAIQGTYPIHLDTGSHSNIISYNSLTTTALNGFGVRLYNSDSNILKNNTATTSAYNSYGFLFVTSSYNILTGNKATTDSTNSYIIQGSAISDFNNSIDSSNLAEGLPVNYTFNGKDLVFDNIDFTQYGQVMFSWGSNITVSNSNFSRDSISFFGTKNSSILGNTINTSNGLGILLYSNADNNSIKHNNINSTSPNRGYGIAMLQGGLYNYIFNNTISTASGAGYGIYLHFGGDNNTIENNNVLTTASSFAYGIFLSLFSDYNVVKDNHIVTLGNFGYGIITSQVCNNNYIDNNKVITSGLDSYGIYIGTSSYNNLTNNDVNASAALSYIMAGTTSAHYENYFYSSNLAEGAAINFTSNINDHVFDNIDYTQYGQVSFVFGDNITITNSNFSLESLSLYQITNSSISYNIFNATGYGIYVSGFSTNNSIDHNVVTTSALRGHGIHVDDGSNSNNITNNLITTLVTYSPGVYMDDSLKNCRISHNIINTSANSNQGIYLSRNQDHDIFNNTITTSEIQSSGIQLYPTSTGHEIHNNTIRTFEGNSPGIYLYSSSNNNNIYGNNISVLGSQGILISSNSNDNLLSENYITTEVAAIRLASGSDNNTFSRMHAISVGPLSYAYALNIETGTHNFVISDSILDATQANRPEFYIASSATSGTWNFTNVTRLDNTPIEVSWTSGSTGILNMHWWLDIKVTNSSADLENAVVTSSDNLSRLAFSESTPADGYIRKKLLEYNRSGSEGYYNFTSPYNLSISLLGYPIYQNFSINLSNNRAFNINLACFCPIGQNYTVRDVCHFSGLRCEMPDYKAECKGAGKITMDDYSFFNPKKLITPINHSCLLVDDTSKFVLSTQ